MQKYLDLKSESSFELLMAIICPYPFYCVIFLVMNKYGKRICHLSDIKLNSLLLISLVILFQMNFEKIRLLGLFRFLSYRGL